MLICPFFNCALQEKLVEGRIYKIMVKKNVIEKRKKNIRTMGFPKIDKGTLITKFFFNF